MRFLCNGAFTQAFAVIDDFEDELVPVTATKVHLSMRFVFV